MSENKAITVIGREDFEEDVVDRSIADWVKRRVVRDNVDPGVLKARLKNFLQTMQEVITETPNAFGEFTLDEVTLTAEVSAKGQVSLLGTGGELGGKGGLTFKLKRTPKST